MEMKRQQWNISQVIDATTRSRLILDAYKAVVFDEQHNERLKSQECQVCYYGSRVGGASITTTYCGICGKEMQFGNTCVDVLCEDCAKKYDLCKHCGGDMNFLNRRKQTWKVQE